MIAPISDELLLSFCHTGTSVYSFILTVSNYKGDLTQSGDDRARAAMGPEAYAHRDWDTVVCNGRVMLLCRSWKNPAGKEPPSGYAHFPAEWYWCMDQILEGRDVEPASAKAVSRVPEDVREDLKRLPGLEFMKVLKVHFFRHSQGRPKAMRRPPPKGVLFFKFQGGTGVAITMDYQKEGKK